MTSRAEDPHRSGPPRARGQTASVTDFYDALADTYHALYPDWAAEVSAQATALDRLVAEAGGRALDIADVACGIGTQLVGLAERGHRVRASDLSRAAVGRAHRECVATGVAPAVCVADMRALPWADSSVDAVVCADNALPHLLDEDDVVAAFAEAARVLRPGGVVVATTRDYDGVLRDRPPGTLPQVFEYGDRRIISFQVWQWRGESDVYDLEHFQLEQTPGEPWTTRRRSTAYRAYRREHLTGLALRAGLDDVTWHRPEEVRFFQPVMTARRPGSSAQPPRAPGTT